MIRKLLFILCASYSLATSETYLSSWTQYRLTELFESANNQDMSPYFTQKAWRDFQSALTDSNIIKEQTNHNYQTRLTKFVRPVEITQAGENLYFAQSTFLVKFSNNSSSWVQPMELILTLKDENGKISIMQFEGKTTKAIAVKNYALDIAKECKK